MGGLRLSAPQPLAVKADFSEKLSIVTVEDGQEKFLAVPSGLLPKRGVSKSTAARWINAGILRQDATTHHLSCVAAAVTDEELEWNLDRT